MRKINRIGEQNVNNHGSLMTIIEYKDTKNITVEFENGYKKKSSYRDFKNGRIKSPYDKTIYNVGYLGEGFYVSTINNKMTPQYSYWKCMLKRCYYEQLLRDNPTYKGCSICEEWHNFQNFAKWFDENYYEVDGEIMDLDKDILFKGNKIYSPETCIFVSHRINSLFTKRDKLRGGYPIGVSYKKQTKKFQARCSVYDNELKKKKQIHLGHYNTPKEAFLVYKEFKENYIKQVAEEYKDKIPQKLYEAMYEYEVEIND